MTPRTAHGASRWPSPTCLAARQTRSHGKAPAPHATPRWQYRSASTFSSLARALSRGAEPARRGGLLRGGRRRQARRRDDDPRRVVGGPGRDRILRRRGCYHRGVRPGRRDGRPAGRAAGRGSRSAAHPALVGCPVPPRGLGADRRRGSAPAARGARGAGDDGGRERPAGGIVLGGALAARRPHAGPGRGGTVAGSRAQRRDPPVRSDSGQHAQRRAVPGGRTDAGRRPRGGGHDGVRLAASFRTASARAR